MNIPQPAPVRKPRQSIRQRLPKRDDSGLTTLEWLLIVAAVAGLAALAVVLVSRVVSDTGEQIAGQSARRTAAEIAAQSIEDDAVEAIEAEADSGVAVNNKYDEPCERLALIYGDVDGLEVTWTAGVQNAATAAWTTEPTCVIT